MKQSDADVILREDLAMIASDRQVSRALKSLIDDKRLAKLSYGIYVRLQYSARLQRSYLPKGFIALAREALTRLGIAWEISAAEKAYNAGITQQVPANPATKLLTRFRRKLSYNNREMRFE